MSNEKQNPPADLVGEAMIDARDASFALRLPYYWFSDQAMRKAKRIPHYEIGGLIRYRMSELTTWAQTAAVREAPKEVE